MLWGAKYLTLVCAVYFCWMQRAFSASLICRNLTGFKSEAVNFTGTLPYQNTTKRIYFGIWENVFESMETSLLTVVIHSNGSIAMHPNTVDNPARGYLGRVKWLGDVKKRRVVFELSHIQESDQGMYAIEASSISVDQSLKCARLVVKPPSVFTFSPSNVSIVRGQSAEFTWKYSLNNDDRRALSSIVFGVYKKGVYNTICEIQVANEVVKSSNCLTKLLVPTTNVTFVRLNVDLDGEAVYEIRLIGTYKSMKSKTRLIVNVFNP